MISIRDFGGIIGVTDKEDIFYRDGYAAAANSSNVDGSVERGTLKGITDNGAAYKANGTDIPDVFQADFLTYEVSGVTKRDLIYIDKSDDDVTAITDFYAAEASRALSDIITPASEPTCIKTFNNAAQIGMGSSALPYAVFRILADKKYFNNAETVAAGLKYEYGRAHNLGAVGSPQAGGFYVSGLTEHAGAGYFQANILYQWAVSLVLDGVQETNLTDPNGSAYNVVVPAAADTTIDVVIEAYNGVISFGSFDKRITAVKLYRAESSDNSSVNLGNYRLVKTIDINAAGWTAGAAHYTYTYPDDGSIEGGATYEEETGLPSLVTTSYVYYGLNTVGGGYHWMAKCGVPGSPGVADWSRYIFRSKKFRPNMVNWEEDFVTIPEVPIALAYYQNKLYAFSENRVYRIDPELLIVEDDFFGAGCSSQRGVEVTEYGMFFCNTNGAYWHNGQSIVTISDVIKNNTSGGAQWSTLGSGTVNYIVKYDSTKRYVLFIGAVSSEGTIYTAAWAAYLPSLTDTPRWDYWDLGSVVVDANSGLFTGKDGEIYLSNATQSVKLFAGATFRSLTWVSPEFHLSKPSQKKCWQKIIYDARAGTGTAAVKYATEGSDPTSGTTVTSGNWINAYKKTMQLYIALTGNAELDSVDITVRELVGER